MKHGSLFSGIGGFDLASEWMGWDNVFNCEIEDFPRKILNYYWPNAISYEDIKSTDFTIHRAQIDILTGGFPCQPYSVAGKRKGKNDERHLWPEMLRAIREISPIWVVGENVRGLVNWNGGLVFDEVQADLEAEGYEVQPFILPAAAVGAPHRRDRVWFVAYNTSKRLERSARKGVQRGSERLTDTCDEWVSSNAESERDLRKGRSQNISGREKGNKGIRAHIQYEPYDNGEIRPTTNANCQRLQSEVQPARMERQRFGQPNAQSHKPTWQNFPTQPPICGGDDGLPTQLDGITFPKWRNESIKGYGNAVVPQVVYQIFKAIQEYENTRAI